jgi:hypothetical protein
MGGKEVGQGGGLNICDGRDGMQAEEGGDGLRAGEGWAGASGPDRRAQVPLRAGLRM